MISQQYFKTEDPYSMGSDAIISLNGSSGRVISFYEKNKDVKLKVFHLLYPTGMMSPQFLLTDEIDKAMNEKFKQ